MPGWTEETPPAAGRKGEAVTPEYGRTDHGRDGKETKERKGSQGGGRDEFKESYEERADSRAREGNKGIPPKETTTERRPRK